MTEQDEQDEGRGRFRGILIRVLTVQVVTVLLLWLLQSRYSPG
jgi:hypothetical protein